MIHHSEWTCIDAQQTCDIFHTDQPWYVLHTRSRQEKAVADDLAGRRIPHYLPLIRQTRFYGKRKARVDLPLFPGYVFMRGRREQVFQIDRTRRVANILDVPDAERLAWELANIRLALDNSAPLDAYPRLVVGARAEVRSGPFKGIQGIVECRPRPDKLFLQVDMLGRAVSIEIDPDLLDLID